MEEEEAIVLNNNNDNKVDQELMDLPPGFRFYPTDEEIITHYVKEKVMNTSFSACAIGEVDLNKSEPWDLPKKAKMEEKEYYFFCRRDRKYPTGMRTNRATAAGYWKATGKDREIYEGKGGCLVGMKKTLVFYQGRAPKGEKTNWVMHEYRLEGKFSYHNLPKGAKDEWVVCRVFHKNTGGIKNIQIPGLQMNDHSFGDHYLFDNYASLPPLMDPSISTSIPNHGDDQNEFKPINTAASTSSRSHNYQNQLFSSYQNNNPNPACCLHQGAIPSTFETSHLHLHLHHHHHQKLDYTSSHCKAHEQFSSNQSMISLSLDTGLSTDMNTTTEISSVVSKQADNKYYEDHFDATSIAELDSFWDLSSLQEK